MVKATAPWPAFSSSDIVKIPLFRNVPEDILRQITAQMERHYAHDEAIFLEGEPGDTMFVVLRGQVAISRNGIHLVTRQRFEIIGEQACIDSTVRSATAVAVGSVTLLELPTLVIDELFLDPTFARNLLRVLSDKLRQATEERAYRYAREEALFGQFKAHVAPEVLNDLLTTGPGEYARPRNVEGIILFSDIRNFTERSSTMPPETVASELGNYLSTMVDVIHAHGGLVDKFIGDAIMAVWGFDDTSQGQFEQAFECAVAMVKQARSMTFGGKRIRIGIGLNAGTVFMGNVGSDAKRQFTVLGTPVNQASRLESKSKELGAPIIVGESAYKQLPDELKTSLVEHKNVDLKGIGVVTAFSYSPIAEEVE